MTEYRPPLADIEFVLDHVVGLSDLCGLDAFAHVEPDVAKGALAEYGRFMADVLAPLNQPGDVEGAVRHDDGTVTTPKGYAAAYRQYVDAGWGAVPFPEGYGGGGFPWLVAVAMQEMFNSANMAFATAPLLTQGAIDMLLAHGSEELRETWVPKMVTGEWGGTMNLTEPDAGSDVGALRTKAVPAADGTWRITGTKIFITFGEHDLTDQIVHLVLARTPDAPPGTKGISCFIVPKFLLDGEGGPGARNDVACASIEHKMGITSSPTCVMEYGTGGEGAVGYLIGDQNQGMRYMFTMMNNARLSVGVQGLGLGERSMQQAVAYARDRRQGRAPGAPKGERSPIVDHADVRRMLLTMRAGVEAMRCLLYFQAAAVDRARHAATDDERKAAQEEVDLLTPISKGWCTDLGVELTSLNVQVHGGMGFIEETGAAQHYRDARIAPIYEGTNGIQAMDLVGRKLPMRGGAVMGEFAARMRSDAEALAARGDVAAVGDALLGALGVFDETTTWLMEHGLADVNDALAGATPYLAMFGWVTGGWLLGRSARAASAMLGAGEGDVTFLGAKVATAHVYADHLLPRVYGLAPSVTAGAAGLFAIDP